MWLLRSGQLGNQRVVPTYSGKSSSLDLPLYSLRRSVNPDLEILPFSGKLPDLTSKAGIIDGLSSKPAIHLEFWAPELLSWCLCGKGLIAELSQPPPMTLIAVLGRPCFPSYLRIARNQLHFVLWTEQSFACCPGEIGGSRIGEYHQYLALERRKIWKG